jgi:hypothetical protein
VTANRPPPPADGAPRQGSTARLRWSLTVQALSGGLLLLSLLLATVAGLFQAVVLASAARWAGALAWQALCAALALAAVAVGGKILGWLWVPLPAPQGLPLPRRDAPALHDLLDSLRARFGIRRAIAINITGEMNAAIAPRPGGLTLQIGLPLLLGVTPRQCAAILSHELGHVVLQGVGPSGWASHARAWWYRVLDRIDLDRSPPGRALAWLLRPLDRRYLTDGLRLARAEEFAADALAADAVGHRSLTEALAALALKEHFLAQDFLPKVRAQVYRRQRPSMLPYRHMAAAFLVGYDPGKAWAACAEAPDDDAPTHPSVRARMARLTGESWPLPGDGASAAETYLGHAVPKLAAALDRAWWHEHGHDWQRHHREVQWALRRIAYLAERGRDQHPLRRLELARLAEAYCPEWNPLTLYLDLLAEPSVRAPALLAVGRLLIEQGNPDGADCLLTVMEQDSEAGLAAARGLLEFAGQCGRYDLAQRAAARAAKLQRMADALERQAALDPEGDGWASPGLDPITRYKLAKIVAAQPDIRRAYLVRRLSQRAPLWQSCLLLIRTDVVEPTGVAEVVAAARALLQDRALIGLLALPAGSVRERAAAAGRTRLHLRR